MFEFIVLAHFLPKMKGNNGSNGYIPLYLNSAT